MTHVVVQVRGRPQLIYPWLASLREDKRLSFLCHTEPETLPDEPWAARGVLAHTLAWLALLLPLACLGAIAGGPKATTKTSVGVVLLGSSVYFFTWQVSTVVDHPH